MDYTGMKFGNLTVLEFSHRDRGYSYYLCQCDCGNTVIRKAVSLKNRYANPRCDDCNRINKKSCNGKLPRTYTYKGETHTVREWSKIVGISESTIRMRVWRGYPYDVVFHPGRMSNQDLQELMEAES